jgi:hypothetical protein
LITLKMAALAPMPRASVQHDGGGEPRAAAQAAQAVAEILEELADHRGLRLLSATMGSSFARPPRGKYSAASATTSSNATTA